MNKECIKLANREARKFGYQKATSIVFEDIEKPRVVERVPPGHVKTTTGELVGTAYLKKFGWKNTHYRSAVTVVALPNRYLLLPEN